jgi:hypothetical protein
MAKNTQSLAKEIRKEGESWDDVMARAKEIIKAEKADDKSSDDKPSEKKSDSKSGVKPNKSKKAVIKGANKQKAAGTKAKKSDLKPGKANDQKAAGSKKVEKVEKPEFAVYTTKQAEGKRTKKGAFTKEGAIVIREKSLMTVAAANAMNEAFDAGSSGRFCVINKSENDKYQKG